MRSLLVAVLVLMASVVSGQTIHQYPYDSSVTAYSSPAAWPLLSAQCHWRSANANLDTTAVPQLMSPSLGHTHMEVHAPIYGEFGNSFTVPFDIMLFHVAGRVDAYYPMTGYLLDAITWDTPDGKQPVMIGDPNGLVMWSGHITVDFKLSAGNFPTSSNHTFLSFDIPPHGWFSARFSVQTDFDNGDVSTTSLEVPFYSVQDVSQPELRFLQDPGAIYSTCAATSAADLAINTPLRLGTQVAEYPYYLPILAPITAAITPARPFVYGYRTLGTLPLTTGMTRMDMDLHNGNPGTLITQQQIDAVTDGVVLTSPFDPAVLGPGTHKVAAMWETDTGNGSFGLAANEQAVALLVVNVTVGGTAPPPPPPVWVTLGGIFQQQQSPNPALFRLCPDSTGLNCQAFLKQ